MDEKCQIKVYASHLTEDEIFGTARVSANRRDGVPIEGICGDFIFNLRDRKLSHSFQTRDLYFRGNRLTLAGNYPAKKETPAVVSLFNKYGSSPKKQVTIPFEILGLSSSQIRLASEVFSYVQSRFPTAVLDKRTYPKEGNVRSSIREAMLDFHPELAVFARDTGYLLMHSDRPELSSLAS